jgi:hypothetical protein
MKTDNRQTVRPFNPLITADLGLCRQCAKPRPPGYTVTCGRSECQEAEFHANRDRAVQARSKRHAVRQ